MNTLAEMIENKRSCYPLENVEEARALIESGFEYVTEVNGVKLFRKRK